MTRKLFVNAVISLSLAALLGACSDGGDNDPYLRVSLHDVAYGGVVSKQFKYKFTPDVVALYRHMGLVREGNEVEFIAARSLADKIVGLGDNLEFGVVKRYSPYVYFKVERIVSGIDTVFPAQAGGITLPTLTTPEMYGIDNFDDYDVNEIAWNNTSALRNLKDRKIQIKAKIVEETVEGEPVWWLIGEQSKLRIGGVTDGIGLFLKALAANNYEFDGGIRLIEVEEFGLRRRDHIAGTVAVDYVMYGDRLVTGG